MAVTEADRESSIGGLVGDSATISVAVAVSRITGLARILVVAAVLGPTVLGDLFVAINVLPLILYDIIAGSAISSVLVPPIVRLLATKPIERAREFVANATGAITAIMALVVAISLLGRTWIASALTAGVERALADQATKTAALLLLLIVPQLILYALIGVFVSVQHAKRQFLLPSAAPIVENLTLIATIIIIGGIYGTGLEVDEISTNFVLILAAGSGLAVCAHAAVQWAGAKHALGQLRISVDRTDPDIRDLVGPARDSVGWSTVIALRQFALVVAAAYAGAGAVQAFEIASLIYFIPLALIGRPIASAALPRLATQTADELTANYLSAQRLAAWAVIPAGLALITLANPLAAGIAYGEFNDDGPIQLLTFALVGLGVGAASEALFEIARQTTMAHPNNRKALRRSTWIRAAITAAGIPGAVALLDGPHILLGLGLVVSASDLTALIVLHRSLRTRPASETGGPRHWPRILAASVLGLGLAVAVDRVLLSGSATTIGGLVHLAIVGATAVVTFLVAAWLLTDHGQLLAQAANPPPATTTGVAESGSCADSGAP